jgi:hypothetical protein
MAMYFFHLHDGAELLLDPDGRELSSLAAVVAAALFEARAIIGADAQEGKIALGQRIDVEDDTGATVHTLQFEDAVHIVRG